MTVLVKNPKRLFQDAPSKFAYLGVANEVLHRWSSTKDGTLRPVSYSSALDHLRWSRDGMVKPEVGPLDLTEEFDKWEMLVLWDLVST